MTTFLLVRHALCDPVGKSIAGRQGGIHLNTKGQAQAQRLADRLSGLRLTALYSSPLERALETAAPIGVRQRLTVEVAPGFLELDFGDWTGQTLARLEPDPEWRAFNVSRSRTRIPGGETMSEVLARAIPEVERLYRANPHPGDLVAIVSHGDVLRAMLTHYLGMSMDLLHRIELEPASVSILSLESQGPRVLLLNGTGDWPGGLKSGD